MMCDCVGMRLLLVLLHQIFPVKQKLCSVKLAKTKGKVVSWSTVGEGLTSLFGIGSESVDGVGTGGVGMYNRRESLILQNLKNVERCKTIPILFLK